MLRPLPSGNFSHYRYLTNCQNEAMSEADVLIEYTVNFLLFVTTVFCRYENPLKWLLHYMTNFSVDTEAEPHVLHFTKLFDEHLC